MSQEAPATPRIVQSWLRTLNERRIDDLVAFYAPDAVLLPTFSPNTIRDSAARRRYFELLTARRGLAVSLHEKTLRVQRIAGGLEVSHGIYRFEVEIDDEPLTFEARFSFVIDPAAAQPILHHHSSQIPRTLS